MEIGVGVGGECKTKPYPIKNLKIIFLSLPTQFPRNYSKFSLFGVGLHGAPNPWRILPSLGWALTVLVRFCS